MLAVVCVQQGAGAFLCSYMSNKPVEGYGGIVMIVRAMFFVTLARVVSSYIKV